MPEKAGFRGCFFHIFGKVRLFDYPVSIFTWLIFCNRELSDSLLGETEDTIKHEIDQLIQDKNATWEVGTLHRKSWTGMDITYEPFHLAWKIDLSHELSKACIAAYQENFGKEPTKYDFWDFSTNAVTPVSMGIPTIGFGPGEYKLAHMRNENCEVRQIIDACNFYTRVINKI